MPTISHFQIHFPKPVYYAGETLSGTVVLELNKPIEATRLKLEITGGVHVEWTDIYNEYQTMTWKSEEIYLNYANILWQRKHEKDVIDKGKYEYAFSVPIPTNATHTFAFPPYASCSYEARAVIYSPIYRPSLHKSVVYKEVTKPFSVHSLLDLNSTPRLNGRLRAVKGNNKISLTVLLPKSGFVPGETINLDARLVNNSPSKKIERIEATVYQNVKMKGYRGREMREKSEQVVVLHRYLTVDIGPNTPNRQVFWDLKIPSRVYPTLQTCNLVNVSYALNLKLNVSGVFIEPVAVEFPIVLGTVALREEEETASAPSVQQTPPEYNTVLPPPSYSESMKSSD